MKKLLLFLMMVIWCQGAWADITTGLVGYWKFNEGSGSTATDSGSGGNNGTSTNSPTYTTGKIGPYALTYLSSSSQHTDMSGLDSAITYSAITVSAWMNFSSTSGSPRVIANAHTDSNGNGFQLGLNFCSGVSFDIGNTIAKPCATNSTTINTGTWYLITATWDGTTIDIYVNGSDALTTTQSLSGGTVKVSSYPFAVGYNPEYSGDYTSATIDDVRLYNRALSPSDITQLYNYTGATSTNQSVIGKGVVRKGIIN